MKNFIFISPHFPESYWKWCIALKQKGFNVLGIGDAPYNDIPEECKYALTEYYCCYDMNNFDNEKEAVRYFKDKYGEIDNIESMNEYWLIKDAMLRTEFNVKNGLKLNEIEKFKYKSKEKEFFKKAGAKIARFIVFNNDDNISKIKNFVKEVNYPIFAKPDNGVGAQHTFKINSNDDIKYFLENKINETYIIEEYVEGRIVSYDGICDNDSNVILQNMTIFSPSESEIVLNRLDDSYYCNPDVSSDLEKIGKSIVKAFNYKSRFFHIEFFRLTKSHKYLGKKDSLVALEFNARCPGGYTPDLINFAHSLSCYDIYADIVNNNTNSVDMNKQKYIAITSSRRFHLQYENSDEEIINKYRNNICMQGVYPEVLRDDLGDTYYYAKFDNLDLAKEFDEYVRKK